MKVIELDKNRVKLVAEEDDKKDYYVRIPQKWWRKRLAGLKPVERCLLVSLFVWGQIRPSKSQLARELGVSRLTIIRTFKKLKKKGFL